MLKKLTTLVDRGLESSWFRRLKEARELLLLVIGLGAAIVVLLREPGVVVSITTIDLGTPWHAYGSLREEERSDLDVARKLAGLVFAKSLVEINIRNTLPDTISVDLFQLAGAGQVLDYSIEWGTWNSLRPSTHEDSIRKVDGSMALEFPFLDDLPPHSNLKIQLWTTESSLGLAPRVLVRMADTSVATTSGRAISPLADFVSRYRIALAVLLFVLFLWGSSRRLHALSKHEVESTP